MGGEHDWALKAQLVFGTPTNNSKKEKEVKPLEERVLVKGI
jgi:predicted oxidoreductase (fatty acid repression mutant protein)